MTTAIYPERQPMWPLKQLGCFEISRDLVRFRWGEVSPRWGLGVELCLFEDHWSISLHPIFGKWFIFIPTWLLKPREPYELMESWGFQYNADSRDLHLHWGRHTRVFFNPFGWKHYSTEILTKAGNFRQRKSPSLNGDEYDSAHAPLEDVHVEQHPYHCLIDDGEVQHVTATVCMERTTWRRFKWLPWPHSVEYSIDIEFDDEVGERAGSWKGGCLGCVYTMRRGERVRDTLRRMQRERRFR